MPHSWLSRVYFLSTSFLVMIHLRTYTAKLTSALVMDSAAVYSVTSVKDAIDRAVPVAAIANSTQAAWLHSRYGFDRSNVIGIPGEVSNVSLPIKTLYSPLLCLQTQQRSRLRLLQTSKMESKPQVFDNGI